MSVAPALCVLGSGSAGNCTIVRRPDGSAILIDAGLSPRATRDRLQRVGACWSTVTDILLTHADRDHFHQGWVKALAARPDVTVHLHFSHAAAIESTGLRAASVRILLTNANGEIRTQLGETPVAGAHLPHDAAGTIGYRLELGGATFGYATDLGRVPSTLLDLLDGVDLLCLESNYDAPMQVSSQRPEFLKTRIMGGHGHLSNAEALAAADAIAARSRLRHLVLLHLSRQCNCPRLLRELYRREAPHLAERLVLTDQHEPTRWLTVHDSAVEDATTGTPSDGIAPRWSAAQVATS